MTITNGYATLQEFKNYKNISSTDATDDSVIEDIIETVSRYIDRKTGRTFYARTATKYYDVPIGLTLCLDEDLLSVTKLLNGDGSEIVSANYILIPPNSAPYHSIRLKTGSGIIWVSDNGETESVISVAGSWGYSSTTPDDIKGITLEIAANIYARRSGQGAEAATITGAGVVLQPKDVSGFAHDVLAAYRRIY